MMAAATILEKGMGHEIHLFEKNPTLGRKVIISGGGRCNVTTGILDTRTLMSRYTRGASFLRHAFVVFGPAKVRAWFEAHGVPLKCEEDLRVFPQSDDGADVVGVFMRLFAQHDVRLHLSESVRTLAQGENTTFSLTSNKGVYEMDIVIITTGGNAYRHTGSTGDGYDFARALGHQITPLGPSLNSFETQELWCKELSGLSLEHAQFEAVVDGTRTRITGPMVFTHFGVSGPAVFALSSHIAFAPIAKTAPFVVSLLPIAGRTFQDWDQLMQKAIEENGVRQVLTVLAQELPKRLAQSILQIAGIPHDKKLAVLTKEERRHLVHLLSGDLHLTFLSRRAGDEFVTAGGVALSEVQERTMESRLQPGLFFAGEVLDIDGVTGGFNLQASWATGRVAGLSIA